MCLARHIFFDGFDFIPISDQKQSFVVFILETTNVRVTYFSDTLKKTYPLPEHDIDGVERWSVLSICEWAYEAQSPWISSRPSSSTETGLVWTQLNFCILDNPVPVSWILALSKYEEVFEDADAKAIE